MININFENASGAEYQVSGNATFAPLRIEEDTNTDNRIQSAFFILSI